MSLPSQQSLKPQHVAGSFHSYHHFSLQLAVELFRFCRGQFPFCLLSCFRVDHRNLLETRMEITAYNLHWRLLSFRVLVFCKLKFTRLSRGAVVVMKSSAVGAYATTKLKGLCICL